VTIRLQLCADFVKSQSEVLETRLSPLRVAAATGPNASPRDRESVLRGWMLGPMAETYRCRRENSRPEPVFRYFSNDRAFASDLNAIALSMRHGRHLAVYMHVP